MKALVQTIKSRSLGKDHDIQYYIESIESIVKRVIRTNSTMFQNIIDPVDFLDKCWEKMEKNLINRIRDLEFSNDSKLVSFITKSFGNMLQEMINEKDPDLDTRKRQARRVLNNYCLQTCSKTCHCWKLKKYKDKTLEIAPYEQLKNAVISIKLPEILYPKKEDSKRGPSISDSHMAKYLTQAIDGAGGMTNHRNLIELIKSVFVKEPVNMVNTEHIETIQANEIFGQDHYIMAYEICTGMDDDLKNLYYYRYIDEMKLSKIAEKLKVSLGSVSNKLADLDAYLSEYLEKCSLTDYEKTHAVLFLVSKWIIDEKDGYDNT